MESSFLAFVAQVMEMDPAEVTMEMKYRESEKWDSLMMLTLVMELEAEYDASIPMEKLGDVKTLGDLYALIA